MSRLVFIYSSPVSTRARVTIAWHAKRLGLPNTLIEYLPSLLGQAIQHFAACLRNLG